MKNAAIAASVLALVATSASAATKPFSEVDTDGDGKMSVSESVANGGNVAPFIAADKDRDGVLSKRELNAYNQYMTRIIAFKERYLALPTELRPSKPAEDPDRDDDRVGGIISIKINSPSLFTDSQETNRLYGQYGSVNGFTRSAFAIFINIEQSLDFYEAAVTKAEEQLQQDVARNAVEVVEDVKVVKKVVTKDERTARHEAQRQESEKNQNNGQVTASRTEPTTPPAGAEEENQEGSETENSGDQSGESEGAGGESSDSGAPDGSGGPDGGDGGSEGPGGPDGGAGGPGDPDGGIGGEGDFPAG